MSPTARAALVALLVALPLSARDPHSFSNPEHVRVRHLGLDITTDFDAQVIRGTAILKVDCTSTARTQPLVLDTRGLTIQDVQTTNDDKTFASAQFELGKADPILGQALTIAIPANVTGVHITYATGPKAAALQWLSPRQTAGKKHSMLFTQSQAIDARSWVPLQDSPGVRFT